MSSEESEYQKLWTKIRENINLTAKDYVPKLYEALKKDGYDAKESRDKIKKDAFNIWKAETIDKHIPAEAKQEIKVLAGKRGQEIKSAGLNPATKNIKDKQNQDTNQDKDTNNDKPPTTIPFQKASELEDSKLLEMERELEQQKKLTFDKQEHIQQLEIKVERLTDQVDAQAQKLKEYMKQETTKSIQDDEKKNEVTVTCPFTLPEKQLFMQCEKCHTGNTHIISGRVYSKKEWVPYQDHTAEQKQRLEKWGKV